MRLFVEYHLIQNFAPSNLNRDDTGSPKDALFGGFRRVRVSSQCFKRAIRQAAREYDLIDHENRGVRTQKLLDALIKRLSEKNPEEARPKIEAVLAAAGLQLKDGKSQYLLFLGERELDGMAELVLQYWDDLPDEGSKKAKKEAKNLEFARKAEALLTGGKAVDVALFGRMLADMPGARKDAACQVAHAISTHRVDREFDYFTAVDDLQGPDQTGAGMIGLVEFNSATFYRYASLSVGKLVANLQNDRELALSALGAFTEAMVRAIPSGKQNSFAANNLPAFVGVCLRHQSALSLANAFERPVMPRVDKSLSALSIEALAEYENKVASAFASDKDQWIYLDLADCWPTNRGVKTKSLSHLVETVRTQVESYLEG